MVLDVQPVTNAALPNQGRIPVGDWDMQLSWSVSKRVMTLKIPQLKEWEEPWQWEFKECAGRVVCTGTDNKVGRILLRGAAQLKGDMLHLWRPDDAVPHPMVEGDVLFPGENPHTRLCYQRATEEWRALDDHRSSPTYGQLKLGTGYVGDLVAVWRDHGSHIFHGGPIKQPDGLFHLYDPLIEYHG